MAQLTLEQSQVLGNYIAVRGVIDGGLGKRALSILNNEGVDALRSKGGSDIKTLFDIQEWARNTSAKGAVGNLREQQGLLGWQHLMEQAIDEGYAVSVDEDTFSPTEECMLDMAADMQLENEASEKDRTEEPEVTPEMFDWVEGIAKRTAETLMTHRSIMKIRRDSVRDIRLVLGSAIAASENFFRAWRKKNEGEEQHGSMKMCRLMQYIQGMIEEILFGTIIATEKDPAYGNALRMKVKMLAGKSSSKVGYDRIELYTDDEAWTQRIRMTIASVMNGIDTSLTKAVDVAERRLRLGALADIVKPVAEKQSKEESDWNTCLPHGHMIYSELLPSGQAVYFGTHGEKDTTTVAVAMNTLDPFLETPLTGNGEAHCEENISLCRSLCVTIREQQSVTPDDRFALCRPVRGEDDALTPCFLQCDGVLRRHINEIWNREPNLMSLAATADPLVILRNGDSFLISCESSGHQTLREIFPDATIVDPTELTSIPQLKIHPEKLKKLCAIRIPIERLLPKKNVEVSGAVVTEVPETDTVKKKKHPLREVFPEVFTGGYRRYATVLGRMGASFVDAKGSHIKVHFRGEKRPAIHAYEFCKRYHSSLPTIFIQTELMQLGIDEEKFLAACGEI